MTLCSVITYYLLNAIELLSLVTAPPIPEKARMHRMERLPIMRMATIGEILKSAQTDFFANLVKTNCEPDEMSRLGDENVAYGWTSLMD